MIQLVFFIAFGLGAAAIGWMGATFMEVSPLGLAVIAVIAGVYGIGFIELIQFRRATATLTRALAGLTASRAATLERLDDWLASLNPTLQGPVRLRIEGERTGLPVPVLTPYLVSLLVMLGLLGTFAGMVDTLKGAVTALEGTTALEAIRAGLSAPIGGLSLAFGTSVAGVAASAMLGLMSTLSRRDRLLAVRQLDDTSTRWLGQFSLVQQRQDAYRALQQQSQGLPALIDNVQALVGHIGTMSDTLAYSLSAQQERWHETTADTFATLARSVDQSLKDSLAQSARLAGESLMPVVQAAMQEIRADLAQQTQAWHQRLLHTTEAQLAQITAQVVQASERASALWTQGLHTHAQANDALMARLDTGVGQLGARLEAVTEAVTTNLQSTTAGVLERLQQTQEAAEALMSARMASEQQAQAEQARLMDQLTTTVSTELARLTAAEAERGQAALARDQQLQQERRQSMAALDTLAVTLEQTATGQLAQVEGLLHSVTQMLQSLSGRFGEQVGQELDKMTQINDQFASSSIELASLAEAFDHAVSQYSDTNGKLMSTLNQIESALEKSALRSDEQLGYYVAQARELIDHSLLTQKEIFEELRHLAPPPGEARKKTQAVPAEVV